MTRIFLPPEQLQSDQAVITGEQARHLALVLRLKPGDLLTIHDGAGFRYSCRIQAAHKKEVLAEVLEKSFITEESPLEISLAQGIAKGEKMDFIIQKSTELGVNRIIPLFTSRTQGHHTSKTARWRKIALSASEQSGRDRIPEISDPLRLEDFLAESISPAAQGYIENIKGLSLVPQARIILSEDMKERNLKKVIADFRQFHRFTFLVGPEGGFSAEEVNAAVAKEFIPTSLGQRIMRTETAPLVMMSILQYELGDIG